MKRLLIFIACVMIGAAILIACGVLGTRLMRKANLVYTDGNTIRMPADLATVRQIMWEAPEALSSAINSRGAESGAHISADGLTLLFARGPAGGNADIFIATRQQIDQPWREPNAISAITSLYDELGPELSRDGQTLYFASNRPGGLGGFDIWVSQREGNHWREPLNLGPSINTPFDEIDPALSPDESRLYFASNRPRLQGDGEPHPLAASRVSDSPQSDFDLYSAITDGRSDAVTPLHAINSPHDDRAPAFTPVGDFLYFASNRDGGAGGFDLYRARNLRGEFDGPENVGLEINSASNELDPMLAMEGFELHFASDRLREAGESTARQLNLYRAISREVFTEIASTEPLIDLASLLNTLLPSLLWLLLGLLLLLALLAMLRGVRSRQLSLLARCLLASLMAHLIALMLLTFWQVTTSIAHALERGGVKVALVTSASADDLSQQIRGALTEIDVNPLADESQRSETALSVEAHFALAQLETSAVAAPQEDAMPMEIAAEDAAAPALVSDDVPLIREQAVQVAFADVAAPAPLPATSVSEESPRSASPAVAPEMQPVVAATQSVPATIDAIDVAPSRIVATHSPATIAVDPQMKDASLSARVELAGAEMVVHRAPEAVGAIDVSAPRPEAPQATGAEAPTPIAIAAATITRTQTPTPESSAAITQQPVAIQLSATPVSIHAAAVDPTNAAQAAEASVPETSANAPDVFAPEMPAMVAALTGDDVAVPETPASAPSPAPAADAVQVAALTPDAIDAPTRAESLPALSSGALSTAVNQIDPEHASIEVSAAASRAVDGPLRDSAVTIALPAAEDQAQASMAPAASLASIDVDVPAAHDEPASGPDETPQRIALNPTAAASSLTRAAPNPTAMPTPHMAHVSPPSRSDIPSAPAAATSDSSAVAARSNASAAMPPLPLVAMNDISKSSAAPFKPAPLDGLAVPSNEVIPPDPFVQRQPEYRAEMVQKMGGSEATENAVALALKWLAAHQDNDGKWAAKKFDDGCGQCKGEGKFDNDIATTALSIMCFLAANHTHKNDGPYRENVERALNWLIAQQKDKGDLRGTETMYSHAIGAIALSEAFGMTRDEKLFYPAKTATEFIIAAQNRRTGGWRYDPGQSGDTSVLGWQIMALVSAKRAGVVVPERVFELAGRWLNSVSTSDRRGLYAYQPGKSYTPSMTAEGMFVQQLLGVIPAHPRMQESAKFILQNPPRWKNDAATYYWYYATLAMFQHQGREWREWNAAITEQLLASQRTDGAAAGSWDPVDNWSKIGGRVYQTALCTLCLEVYYRYLPMFADVHVADER